MSHHGAGRRRRRRARRQWCGGGARSAPGCTAVVTPRPPEGAAGQSRLAHRVVQIKPRACVVLFELDRCVCARVCVRVSVRTCPHVNVDVRCACACACACACVLVRACERVSERCTCECRCGCARARACACACACACCNRLIARMRSRNESQEWGVWCLRIRRLSVVGRPG